MSTPEWWDSRAIDDYDRSPDDPPDPSDVVGFDEDVYAPPPVEEDRDEPLDPEYWAFVGEED